MEKIENIEKTSENIKDQEVLNILEGKKHQPGEKPKNLYFIKAVVYLRKAGMNWYQILKAFNLKDKRNLIYYFKKYKDKFLLPNEK